MPTRSSAGPMRSRASGLTGRGQDLQVLPAGEMAMEAGLVHDRPDTGERHVAVLGHRMPEQRHRAGFRLGEPQQHPDQRRLARAVRTEVTERAPARNEELHVIDRDVVPEPLRQPVRLHRPTAPARPIIGDISNRSAHLTLFRP